VNREQYLRLRRVEDDHWWYRGMRAIALDALTALPLPRDGLVLDAGCGTGGNAAMLGRFGRVVGVDLAELALELASERGLPRLTRATVAALPFGEATFDLVTSFEVLYHRAVGDDVAALRELRRVLRPGGWLLVRLPALGWLRGGHDAAVHAARRYTLGELRTKLRRAGLEPVRLTYLNSLLLPLAAARRAADRLTGARGDDLGPTPALATAALGAALARERQLLRRCDLPLGVSVMATARRAPSG
jgi:SAM-dependent methyltransferase